MATDLAEFAELIPLDHGLCVVSTLRGDGGVQSSVVNAGVLEHPLRDGRVVGLVARGGSRKLHHLRADPRATIVARAGWRWATVEGDAEIIGPDDPHPDVDGEALRLLLRDLPSRRRDARRLGHLRPRDGGRAASRRAHRPARRLHQRAALLTRPRNHAPASPRVDCPRCSSWRVCGEWAACSAAPLAEK